MRLITKPGFSSLLVVAFCGSLFSSCHDASITADEVVERNTNALGGRAAIEAVQTIEIGLHITDPGFEVDGTYRAMRPGLMRIDALADGKPVFTEAYDGKRAWMWTGAGAEKEESPQATAVLRRGIDLPGKLIGLHELRQRGHQISLAGREKLDGVDYHVLRLTMNDGFTTSLYVDPQTWLVMRRRDVRPLHIDIDPTPTTIEQRFSDYRQIGGASLRLLSIRFDILAHASPRVDLIRQIDRQHEIIEGEAIKSRAFRRTVVGILLARSRRGGRQRWIVISANIAQCSARFLVLRRCCFQILI